MRLHLHCNPPVLGWFPSQLCVWQILSKRGNSEDAALFYSNQSVACTKCARDNTQGHERRADQMSAGKEYGSELMRSGDMYVTVPRNVWHCAALHRRWLLTQSRPHPAPRLAGSDAICSGSIAAFGELNTTSQEATALLIAGFYRTL